MADNSLKDAALNVLAGNDQGAYTQPAHGLYPHQWLWDSCFIAIGLRHSNVHRAQAELNSLLRGQWHNGMMPNIIFKDGEKYRRDRNHWRSWLSPFAPSQVSTSGYTQPPMLAEAVVRVGQKMTAPAREAWFKSMYPALLSYHQWLYKERDPHGEGLILLIHPCETGLDNTPPWMNELHGHLMPPWIRLVEKLGLDHVISRLRSDIKVVPSDQRTLTTEALAVYDTELRLRRKNYDINRILDHSLFAIEDLNYNCIVVRANSLLLDIARVVGEEVPQDLLHHMHKTETALEDLWDPFSSQYYSRDFVTHKLLLTPSIATLLPLYAGSVSKQRAKQLVELMRNEHMFNTNYPVPSVPISSNWFREKRYWQGPTWVNTNWLIIDGLKRYGFSAEAEALRQKTTQMVSQSGFYEYFDTFNGKGLGAPNFSWTAALTLDLLKDEVSPQ